MLKCIIAAVHCDRPYLSILHKPNGTFASFLCSLWGFFSFAQSLILFQLSFIYNVYDSKTTFLQYLFYSVFENSLFVMTVVSFQGLSSGWRRIYHWEWVDWNFNPHLPLRYNFIYPCSLFFRTTKEVWNSQKS